MCIRRRIGQLLYSAKGCRKNKGHTPSVATCHSCLGKCTVVVEWPAMKSLKNERYKQRDWNSLNFQETRSKRASEVSWRRFPPVGWSFFFYDDSKLEKENARNPLLGFIHTLNWSFRRCGVYLGTSYTRGVWRVQSHIISLYDYVIKTVSLEWYTQKFSHLFGVSVVPLFG